MKVYEVKKDDEVLFYVKRVDKIGNLDPLYRVLRFINEELVEGDYYYPDICKKIDLSKGKNSHEVVIDKSHIKTFKVLVPVPEHLLEMDKDFIKSYVLTDKHYRTIKFTHLREVSEEELNKMLELTKDL